MKLGECVIKVQNAVIRRLPAGDIFEVNVTLAVQGLPNSKETYRGRKQEWVTHPGGNKVEGMVCTLLASSYEQFVASERVPYLSLVQ